MAHESHPTRITREAQERANLIDEAATLERLAHLATQAVYDGEHAQALGYASSALHAVQDLMMTLRRLTIAGSRNA